MSFTHKMYISDLMSHKEQEQEQHIRSMDPRCSRSKTRLKELSPKLARVINKILIKSKTF